MTDQTLEARSGLRSPERARLSSSKRVSRNSGTLMRFLTGALLPVMAFGVTASALGTRTPGWWRRNFSKLGDGATTPENIFNATLMISGFIVIVVGHLCVTLLNTSESDGKRTHTSPQTLQFPRVRSFSLATLIVATGFSLQCVGVFIYTPDRPVHNFFAHAMVIPMYFLFFGLPLLAPRLPRLLHVVSAGMGLAFIAADILWAAGALSLTVLEAFTWVVFGFWLIMLAQGLGSSCTRRAPIVKGGRA